MSTKSSRASYSVARICGRSAVGGFTLIELIMVIVILGVLAVFAAPRIFNTGDFTQRGFHDETLSLLRFAQKTAIAQRRTVCVTLNPAGVALNIFANNPEIGGCAGAPVLVPPNAPRGGAGLVGAPNAFQFTPLGGTNQAAAIVITIPNSTVITVEADTGYVHD